MLAYISVAECYDEQTQLYSPSDSYITQSAIHDPSLIVGLSVGIPVFGLGVLLLIYFIFCRNTSDDIPKVPLLVESDVIEFTPSNIFRELLHDSDIND